MEIIRTIEAMRKRRAEANRVALVPTMGALHEGHLNLIRRGSDADLNVVSLFVNPTQFGPNEDFEKYPRDENRDATLAESAGAHVLFAPSVDEMFPRRTTQVLVSEVTEAWEGAIRPTHFSGVATVVMKLFQIVQPTVAIFGRKDLQQCAVIRRMVEDLNVPVALDFAPTVREQSGLALSSRNRYLSEADRDRASALFRTLTRTASHLSNSQPADEAAIAKILDGEKAALESLGFSVDYLAYIHPDTMQPLRSFDGNGYVAVAARIANVRLIDNVPISQD